MGVTDVNELLHMDINEVVKMAVSRSCGWI